MDPVKAMFSNIISQGKADETLFNQAYTYANRVCDVYLLETLARFVAIDSPVDKMISERTELNILKIWASRSGRSTEKVLERFAKESRSTLLLDLAQMEDMPDKFYKDLAKRKSIHLAWNLISNPSVSIELKTVLAENLGKNTNITNRSIWDRLRPLQSLPAELTIVFLKANSNEKAFRVITDLAAEAQRRSPEHSPWSEADCSKILLTVFDRLANVLISIKESYSSWDMRNTVTTIFNYDKYADKEVAFLSDKLNSLVSSLPTGSDLYNTFHSLSETLAKRQVTDFNVLLENIKCAPSPSAIHDAFQEYRSTCYNLNVNYDIDAAGRAALNNPNIDYTIFKTHAHCLSSDTARKIAKIALESNNPELCNEVFARSFLNLSNDLFTEFFDNSTDPNEFVYWLLNGTTHAPRFMTGSAAFVKNMELAFNFLPASTVLQNSQYSAKVSEILSETLGDNLESWETFTSLASEWTGSFTDLLKASGSLLP
jgi:hypothetical protein